MIYIYNTLTNKKEGFKPIEQNKVKMYVCGPTVYDHCHLGHGRVYIFFDFVHRFFKYLNYDVNLIINFTDIDDKIIKKSQEEKLDFKKISKKYIESFFADFEKLNCLPANKYPKVSEYIPDIIEFIQVLIEKGHAYEKNNNVYFQIESFNEYGKLSNKNLEDLLCGARININDEKNNPMDFVLWKKSKASEPFWDSPWGKGRPGWHIECSVMIYKNLGATIDIHAGGADLIFPHHENEIAQSQCLTNKKFVNYWMHNGFVTLNEEKMSKSTGNFFYLKDILKKYEPEILRLFILSAHYRQPINFDEGRLKETQAMYDTLLNFFIKSDYILNKNILDDSQTNAISRTKIKDLENQVFDSLSDDFNTSKAIGIIFKIIDHLNPIISEVEKGRKINNDDFSSLKEIRQGLKNIIENIFGIKLKYKKSINQSDEFIDILLKVRDFARKEKQYKISDFIRDELANLNITIEDTKLGSRWKKN